MPFASNVKFHCESKINGRCSEDITIEKSAMLETHGYKQKFIWQFVHLNVLNLCVKFMRDQDQPFVVKPRLHEPLTSSFVISLTVTPSLNSTIGLHRTHFKRYKRNGDVDGACEQGFTY